METKKLRKRKQKGRQEKVGFQFCAYKNRSDNYYKKKKKNPKR